MLIWDRKITVSHEEIAQVLGMSWSEWLDRHENKELATKEAYALIQAKRREDGEDPPPFEFVV